jgi:hypothetical protein
MQHKIILILLFIALLAAPALAETADQFTITTEYESPTFYTIDFGEGNTPAIFNYSINSSQTLVANQSWLLLGSNDRDTIATLDSRINESFTTDIAKNFSVTAPDNYRFYYLVLTAGFYNTTTHLILTTYTPTSAATATWEPVIAPIGVQTVAEKTGWDAWIENNQTGIMILIICILVLMVWKRL